LNIIFTWTRLYREIKEFIEEFSEVLKNHSKEKINVVFIDDLDRCEDENIINLLIALKLMFAFSNIIFICCIDREATIKALMRKYNGDKEKAKSFLDKLFLFDFNIAPFVENNFLLKLDETSKKVINSKILEKVFSTLSVKNPRQIKKIVNKIIILNQLGIKEYKEEEKKELFLYGIYHLVSLKEKDKELFDYLVFYRYNLIPFEIKGGIRNFSIEIRDIEKNNYNGEFPLQKVLANEISKMTSEWRKNWNQNFPNKNNIDLRNYVEVLKESIKFIRIYN